MATIDFKSIPTDVPLTAENIDRIATRAAELAAAFKRKIEKLQQQVADASGNINRDAQGIVKDADPADRAAAQRLAKNTATRSIAQFRRNIVENSRAERQQILDQFAKQAADAEFLLTLNQSPAQMLGRVALGDAKRTQYQMQLEGAGPIELETAATTAIATGDMPMAAAIVTVVDRRPSTKRPFTVSAFAERVFGPQFAEITAKLKGVILAHKTALAANDEFVRGKGDPLNNLALALGQRAIDEASGKSAAAAQDA